MPLWPKSERRLADVIGCAITVARLSVGETDEPLRELSGKVRSGHAGACARAAKLTSEKRQEIARKAAEARWGGNHV